MAQIIQISISSFYNLTLGVSQRKLAIDAVFDMQRDNESGRAYG